MGSNSLTEEKHIVTKSNRRKVALKEAVAK